MSGTCDSPALFLYTLRLADNALILGHRLSEWIGHAPLLEEELALGNVALDLIGQARLWLSYAGEREGVGRDEDALAYFRQAHEFRNVLLAERPNDDFAVTMTRQYFYDVWHLALLRALGWSLQDAQHVIQTRRPVVDFADVYVRSVEDFVRGYACATKQTK